MELVLFDAAEDGRPSRVIPINPRANRTYHYWHVFVPGLHVLGLTQSALLAQEPKKT